MDFLKFARARWGENWALCRATPRNRERYARCVTPNEYWQAEADWRREHTAVWLHSYMPEAVDLYLALREWRTAIELGNVTFRTPEIEAQARAMTDAALAKAEGRS